MKKTDLALIEKRALTQDIFELKLSGDLSAFTAAGQFVNLALSGLYLRRPISVCDINENVLTLIVRVVGAGTKELVLSEIGTRFDALTGLGNGYTAETGGKAPVLVGGGVGVPPLYYLAKRLLGAGISPTVALGFNDKSDIFYVDEFRALGLSVFLSTVDGSAGTKGFVTDAIKQIAPLPDYAFCCGPEPMLKAVYDLPFIAGGQFSFEARMGCGFGACMGCTCKTKYGSKRICVDGPVLKKEEIIW